MKLPLLPTLIVAAAAGFMIYLGVWQIDRLRQKEGQLAQYAQAKDLPALPFPAHPSKQDLPTYLFRKSSGYCALVTSWTARSGLNAKGESGWAHIATCFVGDTDSAPMAVDIGWSRANANPQWMGGQVSGVIGTDPQNIVRLIADEPAEGLEASALPKIEDVPNNHLGYALTWFSFAGIAVLIYLLALRRRAR